MADGAPRRRRASFGSYEEAVANFAAKPPLNQLHPDALEAYVRGGFAQRADGRVTLRCAPATEAAVFRGAADSGAWDVLPQLGHVVADGVGPFVVRPGALPNCSTAPSWSVRTSVISVHSRTPDAARDIGRVRDVSTEATRPAERGRGRLSSQRQPCSERSPGRIARAGCRSSTSVSHSDRAGPRRNRIFANLASRASMGEAITARRSIRPWRRTRGHRGDEAAGERILGQRSRGRPAIARRPVPRAERHRDQRGRLSTLRQAADLDFGLTVLRDCCVDTDDDVHRVLMEKVFPRRAVVWTRRLGPGSEARERLS